jgi:uncharacterized membrane protein YkvA (DUF1232 family)
MFDAIASSSERDHIQRILRLPISRQLRFMLALFRDGRLAPWMLAPLVGVIAYIILPINIVPKWFFILRKFDNLVIGFIGLWLFVKLTPPEILDENLIGLERSAQS